MTTSQRRMIRVGVHGATGRMGRLVQGGLRADDGLRLAGAFSTKVPPTARALSACDVVVDFSLPDGTDRLLDLLDGPALVLGTTSLSQEIEAKLRAYAARAPVVWASNFSPGITLLLDLVARAAAALPHHDLEIIEMHHSGKRDAPSGTALSLAQAAADARKAVFERQVIYGRHGEVGPRPEGQIGLHAIRGGDLAGEHTIYLAGPGERLQIGHLATGRPVFSEGALEAVRWVAGRAPGLYSMRDVLGL